MQINGYTKLTRKIKNEMGDENQTESMGEGKEMQKNEINNGLQ